jgi:elongation factor Ts
MVTTDQIKELRDETGVSVMQCKKALEKADGDISKAKILLKKVGSDSAAKKADRALGAGTVASYVHTTGTIGSLLLLGCETDFVARNEDFKHLAYEIAMHVTALNPAYVARDQIDEAEIKSARGVFEQEIAKDSKMQSAKPEIQEKAITGKLDSYLRDRILLEQSFIKDEKKTIKTLLDEATMKFGERVAVVSFSRISL